MTAFSPKKERMTILIEKNVSVEMPDGVALVADVYRPEDEGQHPVLMSRTPYGKERLLHQAVFQMDVLRMVEKGYAVVLQDCRGTGKSQGTFRFYLDEAADGAATLEWVRRQSWSNQRIGMFGVSYGSTTQFTAAFTEPDLVQALAPGLSPSKYYGDLAYRGGALTLVAALGWSAARRFDGHVRSMTEMKPSLAELAPDVAEMVNRTPLRDIPELEDGPGDHYFRWLEHSSYDDYWAQFAYSAHDYSRLGTPALHTAGWYDVFLDSTLGNYQKLRGLAATADARALQRLIVGPWTHVNWTGGYAGRHYGFTSEARFAGVTAAHEEFFDRCLMDTAPSAADKPVRIFVMGIDEWRDEDDWPLPDTQYRNFYLHSGGMANAGSGDGTINVLLPKDEPADTYVYDPANPVPTLGGATLIKYEVNEGPLDQRPNEQRDDVLCFTTEPFEAPLEVTGPIKAIFYVSVDAPDTDITASLLDVYPDGRAELLADGILRLRYRDSYSHPVLMKPNEISEISVDLSATSNVFRPHHRLRLHVTSSNFPRYDRNSNTGGSIAEEFLSEMKTATVTLYTMSCTHLGSSCRSSTGRASGLRTGRGGGRNFYHNQPKE
jgi:uncharacterized protein